MDFKELEVHDPKEQNQVVLDFFDNIVFLLSQLNKQVEDNLKHIEKLANDKKILQLEKEGLSIAFIEKKEAKEKDLKMLLDLKGNLEKTKGVYSEKIIGLEINQKIELEKRKYELYNFLENIHQIPDDEYILKTYKYEVEFLTHLHKRYNSLEKTFYETRMKSFKNYKEFNILEKEKSDIEEKIR